MSAGAVHIGYMGEQVVKLDLFRHGFFEIYEAQSGSPFDLRVGIGNDRFLKVQVKTAVRPRIGPATQKIASYKFEFTTHPGRRTNKRRPYSRGQVDIFAIVGLDQAMVGYVAAGERRSIAVQDPYYNPPERNGQGNLWSTGGHVWHFSELTWTSAMEELERASGLLLQ